jgi:hypothetical protein
LLLAELYYRGGPTSSDATTLFALFGKLIRVQR